MNVRAVCALLFLLFAPGCLSRPPADVNAIPAVPEGAGVSPFQGLAGEWWVTVEGPRGEEVGRGEAVTEVVLGGATLRLEVRLQLGDKALAMIGYWSQDPSSGRWQSLWMNDLYPRMSLLEGSGSLQDGVRLAGEAGGVRGRSEVRLEGSGELVTETYGPSGLLRRTRYLRK